MPISPPRHVSNSILLPSTSVRCLSGWSMPLPLPAGLLSLFRPIPIVRVDEGWFIGAPSRTSTAGRGFFFPYIVKKVTKWTWGSAMDFSLSTYYPIFIYLAVVVGFAVVVMIAAHLIGPQRKTPVKQMPYESGMDPIGDTRQRFDVKFYLIAILFLVFDVELLFLYPWASMYQDPPVLPVELRRIMFWEVLIFLATVVIAYVYAWRKGVFRWR